MRLDAFYKQLGPKLNDHPKGAEIYNVVVPFSDRIRAAEAADDDYEIPALYAELQAAIKGVLAPTDAPIDPFTDKELLRLNIGNWVAEECAKRNETLAYFGFDKLKSIDGVQYGPLNSNTIARELLAKRELIKRFERPILITTPIGVSMRNLNTAFSTKKGAMKAHKPSMNWWNEDYEESADFSHDVRGEMVYDVSQFDPMNHGGKTKRELLDSQKPSAKGWRVLVVDATFQMGEESAIASLAKDQEQGFIGLTPEDFIMLEAEGIRAGQTFTSGSSSTWLTGAYFPSLNMVPFADWEDSRAGFSIQEAIYSGLKLGSIRAVKIL